MYRIIRRTTGLRKVLLSSFYFNGYTLDVDLEASLGHLEKASLYHATKFLLYSLLTVDYLSTEVGR